MDIATENSQAIVQCYNYMQYKAIGITTHDLQMGSLFIKQLEANANFPFLSATLVHKKNRSPLFSPHTTISKNNMTIGVIGLTAKTVLPQTSDYEVIAWPAPLKRAVEELANVDLIILLSNLPHQDNLEIAKTFSPINIILEAGQTLHQQQQIVSNNTLISHTPKEGKYIGELQINWRPSKTWQTTNRPILEIKNEIDRLQWFQNRITKRGGAEQAYRNNPVALQEYKKKMTYLEHLQMQLIKSLEKEDNSQKPSTYQTFLHPLKPSILDEPQTSRILKNSRKSANKLRRKTDVLHHFDIYAGSQSCKKCHPAIYLEYSRSRHKKAYKTLVDTSDNNNPNCVFCHVTGLPERLAYVQAKIPDRLLEVGCESCHGAGKRHSQDPKSSTILRQIPETTCLTCHTDDHSDDFNYDRDIEFVH